MWFQRLEDVIEPPVVPAPRKRPREDDRPESHDEEDEFGSKRVKLARTAPEDSINAFQRVRLLLPRSDQVDLFESGRGKEFTSAVKSCKRCSSYCAKFVHFTCLTRFF
jgi:hypothetical protein